MTPIGQAGSMLATSKKSEPTPEGRDFDQERVSSLEEAKRRLRTWLKLCFLQRSKKSNI